MQPDDIARIADWLAATDIGLLELRGPGSALRLRQTAGGMQAETIVDEASEGADTGDGGDAPAETVVTAPSLGVFLQRHPLRADELAPAGSMVTAGQVLGLLQTGPLLQPVRAPADGVLLQALVPHGATVGYGTPLFTLSNPA